MTYITVDNSTPLREYYYPEVHVQTKEHPEGQDYLFTSYIRQEYKDTWYDVKFTMTYSATLLHMQEHGNMLLTELLSKYHSEAYTIVHLHKINEVNIDVKDREGRLLYPKSHLQISEVERLIQLREIKK